MTLISIIYMRKAVLPLWRRGFFCSVRLQGGQKLSNVGEFQEKIQKPLDKCGEMWYSIR